MGKPHRIFGLPGRRVESGEVRVVVERMTVMSMGHPRIGVFEPALHLDVGHVGDEEFGYVAVTYRIATNRWSRARMP